VFLSSLVGRRVTSTSLTVCAPQRRRSPSSKRSEENGRPKRLSRRCDLQTSRASSHGECATRKRDRRDKETKFFFGSNKPALTRPELIVEVSYINHPKVVVLANRLKPDLIAVFGTGLIRGPLLAMGQLGIINLHGGLAPRYRGSDCTFWAMYNGELDQIGCTLHFINAGIDTGVLIAHICPEVTEDDDESTLFWRGVRDSADIYANCLERLERGEAIGQEQKEKGRLYLFKHRTRRHERELKAKLRNGLLKGVHLPARVHWFYGAAHE